MNKITTLVSREGVLQTLEFTRADLQRKLKSGRFRDPEAEKLRDAKTRLLIYNCQVLAGVLKDADLDEIKQRIEQLEEGGRNRRFLPSSPGDHLTRSEK